MTALRCARASADRDEAMAGTASTVRAFLVVQQEGAWGVDALRDSNLPGDVAAWLATASGATGVRPLLVRRHRGATAGVRVFAVFAHPHRPWMQTAVFDDVARVTELDLAALARGESVGLSPTQDPIFLACTHGSHDVCCAARGRPVANALATSHPDLAWEVSHIGGDRFAGNLLVLPDGLYYGRVDADSAPGVADAHLDGRVDLAHLRGRAGFGFATQAAEHHLRANLDLDGLHDLVLVGRERSDDVVTATFATPRGRWRVVVRPDHAKPVQLTCRSPGARAPLVHQVVAMEPGQPPT